MATRQYIGARYVPKFYENSDGTAAWRSGVIYEPLTIVTYNGNSYTSKKVVPATIGDPSSNPAYWVATGVFNEQLESIRQELEDTEARVDETFQTTLRTIGSRRFVIIGDSYAEGYNPDGNVTGWPELMVSYLGLDPDQYEILYKGGSGFSVASQGKSFNDMLNDSSISDPDTVTDIVVEGGYNEYSQSWNTIYSAIGAFVSNAKTKYPNAKVWIGHCGWKRDGAALYKLSQSVRRYLMATEMCRAAYISNSHFALHEYFSCLASDGIHPTQLGQERIARITADVILGGSGAEYGEYRTPSFTPAIEGTENNVSAFLASTFSNGTVHVMTQNKIWFHFPEDNLPSIYCNGDRLVDLGTFEGGYIIGCDYPFNAIPVMITVKTGSGFSSGHPAVLIFQNGHLYICIHEAAESGTAWVTLSGIKEIETGRFTASFDALLC